MVTTTKLKLKKIITIFIILQPFLDIFWLYQPPIATALILSPPTYVRFLMMGLLTWLFLRAYHHQKMTRFFIFYTGVLLLWFIGHQWAATHFYSIVPGAFNYSTLGEIAYIARMVLPLLLLVMVYHVDFSEDELEKIVQWLVGLFSGTIVLTNLLTISLGSYLHQWGNGGLVEQYFNQKITGNIFSWFGRDAAGSYYGFASKGFFNHANTTGAVLILLAPFIFYFLVSRFSWVNFSLAICQILAGFELGTKAAAYGTLLVVLFFIIAYPFFAWLKHEYTFDSKIMLILVLFLVGSVGLNYYSPSGNRQTSERVVKKSITIKKNKARLKLDRQLKKIETSSNQKRFIRFMQKHAPSFAISSRYVKSYYPVKYDPNFWRQVLTWSVPERMNYRKLQDAIWQHSSSINRQPWRDRFFGFGYTRLSNMGLIERDFVSHYYSLGLLGLLLLIFPYLGVLLTIFYLFLRHFRTNFTLRTASVLLGIGLMMFLSLYAGYVMDYLTATLLLAFFMGVSLRQLLYRQETSSDHVVDLSTSINRMKGE